MTITNDLPKPSDADLIRSQALSESIRLVLAKSNRPLTFAEFMEFALYHPSYGYYNASTFDLGKQGDFTTAPEISPLFAKCLAKQCVQIFAALAEKNLLELGAGTGRLAMDLLLELKAQACLPLHYYIYEISVVLREKQKTFLQANLPTDLYKSIVWLDTLPTQFSGIILANEVLDAIPTHCFRIEREEVQERGVTWRDNQFAWQATAPTNIDLLKSVSALQKTYALPDGYESEINLNLVNYLSALANMLTKGVMLFIDYGYGQKEYYFPARSHGTLTCFYQHRHHDNPLWWPGLQDITTHVDFTRVIEIAHQAGCDLLGYTTQAAFLLALGLMTDAAQEELKLSAAEQVNFHHGIKLLTFPMEMGEIVKVMALGKAMTLPLLGFSLQDRSRDL
jgi:SAM-dependent MidA family methyltransferase